MATAVLSVDRTPAEHDYVSTACLKCGALMGYVVSAGHQDWLCGECSPERKPTAVARTAVAAKQAGLKHYFTGKPCPQGHISARYACSHDCVRCSLESRARARHENRALERQADRVRNAENRRDIQRWRWLEHNAKHPDLRRLMQQAVEAVG